MRAICLATSALVLASCGRIAFDAHGDGGTDSTPVSFTIEAESGAVVPLFRIEEDPARPGVFYVIDGNSQGLAGTGSVGFTVAIPATATYYLWVRSIVIDASTDSFTLSIDNAAGTELQLGDCVYGPGYGWGALRPPSLCPGLPPPTPLPLTKGPHVFRFSSREGQSLFDRFLLTRDASFVPSG